MQSFKDWLLSQESSPATRSRWAAFWGLGPMIASPFSHSTPPPAVADKLIKDLKDDKEASEKKHKHKKHKEKEESFNPFSEGKGKTPDYSFDTFVRKKQDELEKTKKDIDDELKRADKQDQELDKKLAQKRAKGDSDDKDLEKKVPKNGRDMGKAAPGDKKPESGEDDKTVSKNMVSLPNKLVLDKNKKRQNNS